MKKAEQPFISFSATNLEANLYGNFTTIRIISVVSSTVKGVCIFSYLHLVGKHGYFTPIKPNYGQNAPELVFLCIDICQLANYNIAMSYSNNDLGKIIKQQRITVPLTLQELAAESGVSSSHLGRIERGERFPSARILRKIAKPLGFDEDELFTLAGFLSPQTSGVAEESGTRYNSRQLDPYVARMLAEEPPEVQRSVIGILSLLKSIAKSTSK
jgi:transcriptional regulator with XRE-family HTH domain